MRRWRHQDFGCWRVGLVASMPRVDCPECGVVVARVPWAEPGSRFTRDFEAECAWLMGVANRKTVSGFLHVAWRAAGDIARRVADRLRTAMPSPFDGLTAIGVDGTSHRKGHTYITVVVGHERHRVVWAHDGYGGDVFDLFFRRLAEERKASIRVVAGDGARALDRLMRRRALPERRTRARRVPHRLLDDRRARPGPQTPVEPGETRRQRGGDQAHARRQARRPEEPGRPDRPAERRARRHQEHGPEGPALPRLAAKELLRTLLRHPLDQARGELDHWVFRASRSRIPEIVELSEKIRRRRPDILRTIRPGYPNARLEASDNRIKAAIRMAYGFHHVDNLIALTMLRCGGLDMHLPQPAI